MEDRYSKILQSLARSKFRSRFALSQKDMEYVNSKGMDTITSHAVDFVETRLAPAYPKNDGKQTPMRGHPVFVAQHATATCCRECLMKWHKIKKERELSPEDKNFVVGLIMAWITAQMAR